MFVVEVAARRRLEVEARPIDAEDLRGLGRDWKFDWTRRVRKAEVFKLIAPESPETVLGLVALVRRTDHVEVALLESRPDSVGDGKRFDGIAGCLLASAVRLSLRLGFDGCLALDAKTRLIKTFERDYGFSRLGQSQRMILEPLAAAALVARHERRPDHEEG